jgi:hypothetical protein
MTDLRFGRYREVYLAMARHAGYRPAAPRDGYGGITLTQEELLDPAVLEAEARRYAADFVKQDDAMKYPIGCPAFTFNKAFCLAIEAARIMCGGLVSIHGFDNAAAARALLTMAIEEIDTELKDAGPIGL